MDISAILITSHKTLQLVSPPEVWWWWWSFCKKMKRWKSNMHLLIQSYKKTCLQKSHLLSFLYDSFGKMKSFQKQMSLHCFLTEIWNTENSWPEPCNFITNNSAILWTESLKLYWKPFHWSFWSIPLINAKFN